MNQIIKKQLGQCRVADLSNYDEQTNTYYIPKYNYIKVEEGESYIVKLDKSLLIPNPGDNFHINWNKGDVPKSEIMFIEVSKVNGKIIKVFGVGYDLETNKSNTDVWSGWLPIEKLTIVEEL